MTIASPHQHVQGKQAFLIKVKIKFHVLSSNKRCSSSPPQTSTFLAIVAYEKSSFPRKKRVNSAYFHVERGHLVGFC